MLHFVYLTSKKMYKTKFTLVLVIQLSGFEFFFFLPFSVNAKENPGETLFWVESYSLHSYSSAQALCEILIIH